jgi:hypothetical protein
MPVVLSPAKRELIVKLFEFQWRLCWLCGFPMVLTWRWAKHNAKYRAILDYELPLALGGTSRNGNPRLAHHRCYELRAGRAHIIEVKAPPFNPTRAWPRFLQMGPPPSHETRVWLITQGYHGTAAERAALTGCICESNETPIVSVSASARSKARYSDVARSRNNPQRTPKQR